MLVKANVNKMQLAAMRGLHQHTAFPTEEHAQPEELIPSNGSDNEVVSEELSVATISNQHDPVGLGGLEEIHAELKGIVIEGHGKRLFGKTLLCSPFHLTETWSVIEMSNWFKCTISGKPFTEGLQHLYWTFKDFALDAKHCLIGHDQTNHWIPVFEELEWMWALYMNVLNATDTIILGHDHIIFHTGVLSKSRGICKYMSGQIFAMECWMFGGNNAFMLGIIKQHKMVALLTTFQHASHKDLIKSQGMEDFRSDYSCIHTDTKVVHHFIVSIMSMEPLMDEHWLDMQVNATLMDLRLYDKITCLLAPEDISGTCSQVADSLMECVKIGGIAYKHLNNAFMRNTDLVIEWHLEKLAQSRPNTDQTLNSLGVMMHMTFFTAQDQFDHIGVDEDWQKIVWLALAKQVAKDVQGRKYGSSFTLHASMCVRDFVNWYQESVSL
ncbi:hypothetical protein EDD16DRAFT_1711921 [Pisolithus croceorrhizus]|nr:hypothetical protein EDD16DRAFT_1711921 [Pisolithus croceorrhizus]KAI6127488.1 hypothetical protein EV401DRAFT_2067646 [Pisolithus croceorrhizus]